MFPLLGVAPIRGRTFDASDFDPGKDQVAVIGYALWQRSFGGSDSVIGQKILLDGENYTVIGVMPAGFLFRAVLGHERGNLGSARSVGNVFANRQGRQPPLRSLFLRVFGRLAPGRSRTQAQAEMDQICHSLAAAYPDTNAKHAVAGRIIE